MRPAPNVLPDNMAGLSVYHAPFYRARQDYVNFFWVKFRPESESPPEWSKGHEYAGEDLAGAGILGWVGSHNDRARPEPMVWWVGPLSYVKNLKLIGLVEAWSDLEEESDSYVFTKAALVVIERDRASASERELRERGVL